MSDADNSEEYIICEKPYEYSFLFICMHRICNLTFVIHNNNRLTYFSKQNLSLLFSEYSRRSDKVSIEKLLKCIGFRVWGS